jgi:hypothetical protein
MNNTRAFYPACGQPIWGRHGPMLGSIPGSIPEPIDRASRLRGI